MIEGFWTLLICVCADMIDWLILYSHVLYMMCLFYFQDRPVIDLWECTYFQVYAVYDNMIV